MVTIPDRLTERVSSLLGPAGSGVRWLGGVIVVCGVTLKGVLLQSGREDIRTATIVSIGLLGPVWLAFGGMEMLGANNSMLCTTGEMGIPTLVVTTMFEALVALFVLKGLLRTMIALSQTRDDLVDPVLSIGAAILPVLLGSVLVVGNGSLIACLYP
ncbi:hypothetical protein [Halocatena pleomorpha]|uniref:Uncharacterized protein n=1 Tax=Halocatena pleomorpha TaxID=1785090 RepID=A0A3P3R514_9EURY|nr:hypothetical protein [Halocatena pleomorpha]RRJ28048.1 hypothetical protein EIK79_16830 [Halocatena pleomorpha]